MMKTIGLAIAIAVCLAGCTLSGLDFKVDKVDTNEIIPAK